MFPRYVNCPIKMMQEIKKEKPHRIQEAGHPRCEGESQDKNASKCQDGVH